MYGHQGESALDHCVLWSNMLCAQFILATVCTIPLPISSVSVTRSFVRVANLTRMCASLSLMAVAVV